MRSVEMRTLFRI